MVGPGRTIPAVAVITALGLFGVLVHVDESALSMLTDRRPLRATTATRWIELQVTLRPPVKWASRLCDRIFRRAFGSPISNGASIAGSPSNTPRCGRPRHCGGSATRLRDHQGSCLASAVGGDHGSGLARERCRHPGSGLGNRSRARRAGTARALSRTGVSSPL